MNIDNCYKKGERFFTLSRIVSQVDLLYFLNDSLECCRIVECEVCKSLAVDFDTCFVKGTHQL